MPILDPQTSTSNLLNKRRKNFRQFAQKIRKIKIKIIGVVKRYALKTHAQNFTKIFENICILKTYIQTEHFLN